MPPANTTVTAADIIDIFNRALARCRQLWAEVLHVYPQTRRSADASLITPVPAEHSSYSYSVMRQLHQGWLDGLFSRRGLLYVPAGHTPSSAQVHFIHQQIQQLLRLRDLQNDVELAIDVREAVLYRLAEECGGYGLGGGVGGLECAIAAVRAGAPPGQPAAPQDEAELETQERRPVGAPSPCAYLRVQQESDWQEGVLAVLAQLAEAQQWLMDCDNKDARPTRTQCMLPPIKNDSAVSEIQSPAITNTTAAHLRDMLYLSYKPTVLKLLADQSNSPTKQQIVGAIASDNKVFLEALRNLSVVAQCRPWGFSIIPYGSTVLPLLNPKTSQPETPSCGPPALESFETQRKKALAMRARVKIPGTSAAPQKPPAEVANEKASLRSLIDEYRRSSIDVVRSIRRWQLCIMQHEAWQGWAALWEGSTRDGAVPPPPPSYIWRGVSYLTKMTTDVSAILRPYIGPCIIMPGLVQAMTRESVESDPLQQEPSATPGDILAMWLSLRQRQIQLVQALLHMSMNGASEAEEHPSNKFVFSRYAFAHTLLSQIGYCSLAVGLNPLLDPHKRDDSYQSYLDYCVAPTAKMAQEAEEDRRKARSQLYGSSRPSTEESAGFQAIMKIGAGKRNLSNRNSQDEDEQETITAEVYHEMEGYIAADATVNAYMFQRNDPPHRVATTIARSKTGHSVSINGRPPWSLFPTYRHFFSPIDAAHVSRTITASLSGSEGNEDGGAEGQPGAPTAKRPQNGPPVVSIMFSPAAANVEYDMFSVFDPNALPPEEEAARKKDGKPWSSERIVLAAKRQFEKLESDEDIADFYDVCRVQAVWRRKKACQRVAELRRIRDAATRIQSLAQCGYAKDTLQYRRRRHKAAIMIQKLVRGRIERRHVAMLKHLIRCIITIQRLVRGFLARRFVQRWRYIVGAAITIQRYWRGFFYRRLVHRYRDDLHHTAAVKIQALWKGGAHRRKKE